MSGRTTLANKEAAAATGRNRRHAPRSGHFSADPLQHTASDSSTTLGIRPRAYRAQNISQGMHLSQKNPGPGPALRVSLGSSTTLPWTRLCGSAGGFLVLHFWRLPEKHIPESFCFLQEFPTCSVRRSEEHCVILRPSLCWSLSTKGWHF